MLTSTPGALVIAERNFEALDEPYWHDLETWVGDGGIIEQNFDGLTKKKLQEVGCFASLSSPPDNVEHICLRLIRDTVYTFDNYVVGVSHGPTQIT